MIDTNFYNGASNINSYTDFDSYLESYNGNKSRFKSILW